MTPSAGDEAEEAEAAAEFMLEVVSAATMRRKLQEEGEGGGGSSAASAAQAMEDKKEDYVVSEWSQCTCYQQCVAGVQKRKVTCPEGSKCKTIVPPSARQCLCTHCSNCQVNLFMMVHALLYGAQGTFGIVTLLCFLYLSNYEEDDFTSTGYCTKCLGFLCKAFPFFVRILTFFTLLMTLLLCMTTYMSYLVDDFQPDCKESASLVLHTMIVPALWLILALVGRFMHGNQPMPPWLHYRSRNKLILLLFSPCRKCGP